MKPVALLLIDDKLNPKIKPITPKQDWGLLWLVFCGMTVILGVLVARNWLDVAGVL